MANEWGGVGCSHPIAEQYENQEGLWIITYCAKCGFEIKKVRV